MSDPPHEPNLTGIPREFPEAAEKFATFGITVVTEVSNLARYLGRIVGTVPEDAVGFVLGDPLHALRSLAAAWYDITIQEKLERRKAKPQPVSLSVAIPLIRGAYDETREGLRDMWADLIANAMDPARAGRVRLSYIETLKRFDPLDALILRERNISPTGSLSPSVSEFMANRLGESLAEVLLSGDNLIGLKCAYFSNNNRNDFDLTPYGVALLRACSE